VKQSLPVTEFPNTAITNKIRMEPRAVHEQQQQQHTHTHTQAYKLSHPVTSLCSDCCVATVSSPWAPPPTTIRIAARNLSSWYSVSSNITQQCVWGAPSHCKPEHILTHSLRPALQAVSYLPVFRLKFCIHFPFIPCVLCVSPILVSQQHQVNLNYFFLLRSK
jgi:hypothetical protein